LNAFIVQTLTIFKIQVLKVSRHPVWFGLNILVGPLALLLFAHWLLPPDLSDEVERHLIAGALVFSLAMASANNLTDMIIQERFVNNLQLIIVSPTRREAYAAGVILYALVQGSASVALMLAFAPIFGISVHLTLWIIPLVLLTTLSLTGIALIIATRAPTWQVGRYLGNVVGILVPLVSPVYYPIDRLPDWLHPIARLSPLTYSADAIFKAISGRTDFEISALVLCALTIASLALGFVGLRWQES
jgi:ABC-type multidrug transport system permease subunit